MMQNNISNILIESIDSIIQEIRLNILNDKQNTIDDEYIEINQNFFHGFSWVYSYNEVLKSINNYERNIQDYPKKDFIIKSKFYFLYKLLFFIQQNQIENTKLSDYNLNCDKNKIKNIYDNFNKLKFDINHNDISDITQINFTDILNSFDENYNDYLNEIRKFTNSHIIPIANKIHLDNILIPDDLIKSLSALDVFAANISNEYGGLGFSKRLQSCITEELSRGYIGVGSLITRNDIASELIYFFGTNNQKETLLPLIANGELLPTAAFTEPNTGSDLSSVKTTANKIKINDKYFYKINGEKTWITHGSRSNLVILLAKTSENLKKYKGLSLFVFKKEQGTSDNLFPNNGISGSEIPVIGYRGMKSFNMNFDNFLIPEDSLIGNHEGNGFKQLMNTFENARIQTASRSNGLSKRAFELALNYALQRNQFNKSIINFPRIKVKLINIFLNIIACKIYNSSVTENFNNANNNIISSSITKMICSNYCWINSDASFLIHGSYGYAKEYEISRILCDSRIMSIFEGTSEIQANIIAKNLFKKI